MRSDRSATVWAAVPETSWHDWKWQMANRIRSVEQLSSVVKLCEEERIALRSRDGLLKIDITPYFSTLLDPDDPVCPIRRQVIPTKDELQRDPSEKLDPLAEDRDSPVPGILHRYPDRVGLLVTTECATYCRFCTRSRLVGKPSTLGGRTGLEPAFQYLQAHSEVRDVLLTGGDPFVLADEMLDFVMSRLRRIRHIQIIRINTRVPIFLPQRVTDSLTKTLSLYHPVWINIHCNHPNELTEEVQEAVEQLANAGIPLGSQSVLLAGVNDCPNLFRELVHKLAANRIRPYYLYQCDPVFGSQQFRTPIDTGIEIVEALRGHTSGYCVPTYVIDSPAGGGKIPVAPDYLISRSSKKIVLRNFEGMYATCEQPERYERHDPNSCGYCRSSGSNRPRGIHALLQGDKDYLAPAGWRVARDE